MSKYYSLFFQDYEVGKVFLKNSNFPSLFGEFEPTTEALPEEVQRLFDLYVNRKSPMSYKESSDLKKLMLGNDFSLKDQKGEILPILPPSIHPKTNAFAWRWKINTPTRQARKLANKVDDFIHDLLENELTEDAADYMLNISSQDIYEKLLETIQKYSEKS